jgi:hypothetical protein
MVVSSRDDVRLQLITMNNRAAIAAVKKVGGIRFQNMRISADAGVIELWNLVLLGDGTETKDNYPRGFHFDKVLLEANDTQGICRGIGAFCGDFAYINGAIAGMKRRGFDSQAICGGNGPGPFLIRDSVLEAASENIMFGGTGVHGPEMVPQDITIERVTLVKRLAWKGQGWNIKNHLEFKSARRVKVRGLRCINCWTDGQVGRSLVLTPRDVAQFPYIVTQDIDIEHVQCLDVNSAFAWLGADDGMNNAPEPMHTARVRIANLFARINAGGKNFEISADSYDMELDRATFVPVPGTSMHAISVVDGKVNRFKNTRNLFFRGGMGFLGARGQGENVADLFPDPSDWSGCVIVNGPSIMGPPKLPLSMEGQDPNSIYVNYARGDYRTKPRYAGRGFDFAAYDAAMTKPTAAKRPEAFDTPEITRQTLFASS